MEIIGGRVQSAAVVGFRVELRTEMIDSVWLLLTRCCALLWLERLRYCHKRSGMKGKGSAHCKELQLVLERHITVWSRHWAQHTAVCRGECSKVEIAI